MSWPSTAPLDMRDHPLVGKHSRPPCYGIIMNLHLVENPCMFLRIKRCKFASILQFIWRRMLLQNAFKLRWGDKLLCLRILSILCHLQLNVSSDQTCSKKTTFKFSYERHPSSTSISQTTFSSTSKCKTSAVATIGYFITGIIAFLYHRFSSTRCFHDLIRKINFQPIILDFGPT